MKKVVMMAAIFSVCSVVLGVQQAHAEDPTYPDSTTTKGTIKFNPNTSGTGGLIKPGTADSTIKIPDDQGSSSTTGSLRFTHVPAFNFGSVAVNSATTDYAVNLMNYKTLTKTTDEDGNETVTEGKTAVWIPQFVQVADERGTGDGTKDQFTVTAKATKFAQINSTTSQPIPAKTLKNTRIRFYGQKLANNTLDTAASPDQDATSKLAGMSGASATYVGELSETATTILSVKEGQTSNSSISSIVFDGNYNSTKVYTAPTEELPNPKNNAVKLHVPSGENPDTTAQYVSTITWILSNAV